MDLRSSLLAAFQRVALVLSYQVNRRRRGRLRRTPISWVVGIHEIASMVQQIAAAIPGSFSINFSDGSAYDDSYSHRFRTRAKSRGSYLERAVVGPVLLGRLMNQADGIIYVGSAGFLTAARDSRSFEFRYLHKKGVPIVCYWCGTDIRSTRRMHELEASTGLPNISTYIAAARGPVLETEGWERQQQRVAAVASRYASAMFSNTVDHLSYLTMGTEPFLYFLPDDQPVPNPERYDDLSKIVIVHATTAPVIKGTPLVRAAIARLREEGYDFEYVELIGVPNRVVTHELQRAHIAMNQFYGFSPAVFGAEAMMAGSVVMMSADETIETDLPAGSNEAWVVTKHHQVYSNLKALLDDPSQLAPIARRGRAWAEKYAGRTEAGAILSRTLDAVLKGSYQAPPVRP